MKNTSKNYLLIKIKNVKDNKRVIKKDKVLQV